LRVHYAVAEVICPSFSLSPYFVICGVLNYTLCIICSTLIWLFLFALNSGTPAVNCNSWYIYIYVVLISAKSYSCFFCPARRATTSRTEYFCSSPRLFQLLLVFSDAALHHPAVFVTLWHFWKRRLWMNLPFRIRRRLSRVTTDKINAAFIIVFHSLRVILF
jgi:hypothetical protein